MPDFERVLDQLRIDLADTDEQRAHAKGFIAGKKHARKEIIYIALFATAIIGLTAVLSMW